VRDHVKPLTKDRLIADSTPLADIFSVLSSQPHMFVLIGPEVRGIVTRADLNKPPVRVYLFGLISLLEMHLTYWIGQYLRNDSWTEYLTAGRLQKANDLLQQKKRHNDDVGLIDCTQLSDKLRIATRSGAIVQHMSVPCSRRKRKTLGSAERLRNLLAHSESDLSLVGSWEAVASIVAEVERVVAQSDRAVEGQHETARELMDSDLWSNAPQP
jgi:hypothetical protein